MQRSPRILDGATCTQESPQDRGEPVHPGQRGIGGRQDGMYQNGDKALGSYHLIRYGQFTRQYRRSESAAGSFRKRQHRHEHQFQPIRQICRALFLGEPGQPCRR